MESRTPGALSKSDLLPLQSARRPTGLVQTTEGEHAAAGDDFAMQLIQKSRRLRNLSPLDVLPQSSSDFPPRDSFADALSKEQGSMYSSGHSDIVTEIPLVSSTSSMPQPKTPKGSPPQSSQSLLAGPPSPVPTHYQEVLQDLRDAPPAAITSAVRLRGPQGYAWEQDTEVTTKYIPTQDSSTPRKPLKPWEPPPIPNLAVYKAVGSETSAVNGGRVDTIGRGAESLVHVQVDASAIAETPHVRDRLQKERLQFKGLFGVFHLAGSDYVVSAVLRGGQLARMVQPGDKLVSIDGRTVSGLSPDQVRHLVDGEVGTEMKLDLLRAVSFSVSVLRTDSEMADIQAGTSQRLLSALQLDDDGDGVENRGGAGGQQSDEGALMGILVGRVKEPIGKMKEDMESTVRAMEEKLTQQAIEMNRTQDRLRADSQKKEEEMKASATAMEDKVKELEQAQEEMRKELEKRADEKVKLAEEKARNDKTQMQNLMDVRKKKAELEMSELRKVAEEHQKVIDMHVAQNKEEFEEKARLLEIESEAKLVREHQRLQAEKKREMEEFQKHVEQQSETARNQEMGAKLEQEKAIFAETLQTQKMEHKQELEQQQQKLQAQKMVHKDELEEQQHKAQEALQVNQRKLREQMESHIEEMRLDFEKHLRGVAVDSSGPASVGGRGGDLEAYTAREDAPDEAMTELAGFMRAEFVKMRETTQIEMEAKLARQQEEFQVKAREYEERLTREQRQKVDEIEALQHKYALVNEEQLRGQKEAGEERAKTQEARFEQMMEELRAGHQNRIENIEHGYEEILATLRGEIEEMRGRVQIQGEREMSLHTTIAELRAKLEEASSQSMRDCERLGLQHREEVCVLRHVCVCARACACYCISERFEAALAICMLLIATPCH